MKKNENRTVKIDFKGLLDRANLSYEDLERECTVDGEIDADQLLTKLSKVDIALEILNESFDELNGND